MASSAVGTLPIQAQIGNTCAPHAVSRSANRILRLTGVCNDNRCFDDIYTKCNEYAGNNKASVVKIARELIRQASWSKQVDHTILNRFLFVDTASIATEFFHPIQHRKVTECKCWDTSLGVELSPANILMKARQLLDGKRLIALAIFLEERHIIKMSTVGKDTITQTFFQAPHPNNGSMRRIEGHAVVLYKIEGDVMFLKNSWGTTFGHHGEFRMHTDMLTFPNSMFQFTVIDIKEDGLPAEIAAAMDRFVPDDKWLNILPIIKESTFANDYTVAPMVQFPAVEATAEEIGRGNTGPVFATNCAYDIPLAVKVTTVANAQLSKRMSRLYRYDHPNIIRHYGAWCSYNSDSQLHNSHVNIVMERGGDTLTAMLDKARRSLPEGRGKPEAGGPLGWHRFFVIVMDVACGVQYLHQHGMTHHDICADNIVLGRDGRWKLTDLWNIVSDQTVTCTPGTGHLLWVEQTALETRRYFTVDLYSLGKLMLYLLMGDAGLRLTENKERHIPPAVWELYKFCTAPPATRITIQDFLVRLESLCGLQPLPSDFPKRPAAVVVFVLLSLVVALLAASLLSSAGTRLADIPSLPPPPPPPAHSPIAEPEKRSVVPRAIQYPPVPTSEPSIAQLLPSLMDEVLPQIVANPAAVPTMLKALLAANLPTVFRYDLEKDMFETVNGEAAASSARVEDDGETTQVDSLHIGDAAVAAALVQSFDVEQLRARALQGDAEAQYSLGMVLWRGSGVEENWLEAATWVKRAADSGHPDAQNLFGYFCHHGIGVDVDLQRAAEYYEMAVKNDHTEAMYNLGVLLHKRDESIQQDLGRAVELFQAAAGRGHVDAQYNVVLWRGLNAVAAVKNDFSPAALPDYGMWEKDLKKVKKAVSKLKKRTRRR